MNLTKCIQSTLTTLLGLIYRKLSDINDIEICPTEGYKQNNTPPIEGWERAGDKILFTGLDEHYWFRASLHTPAVAEDEYLILRATTDRERKWDATNPQGLLYLNGQMVNGFDTNHIEAYLDADTDYTLHNYFYLGTDGGGPTKAMLETQRRTARGIPTMPVTVTGGLVEYLDAAKSEFDATCRRTDRTPKWVGELYLEFHRGTYTSIGKVKRDNRRAEFALGSVEALSATDLCFGGSYDAAGLNREWQKVLHNQFHDILPGSSIKAVYDGTDIDYREIGDYTTRVIDEKLDAISARIDTAGGTLLYNPTGFARNTITTEGSYCETDATVPPFGWTVVRDAKADCRVMINGLTAEKDDYILTLNQAGQIASLYDKSAGREVFKAPGNVLTAFEDYPTEHDAWELEDYYKLNGHPIDDDATITPITDGTRAGFSIERPYLHSTIKQTVWLYSRSRRIDFETDIKQAETGDGIIVRMYEAFDRRSTVTLTVPACFKRAYLCDLMENPLSELALTDGKLSVPMANFEIVTVKLA